MGQRNMKTYKCPCCEQQVRAEDSVPYKNRHYHKTCYNNTIKELTKKKAEKLSSSQSKKGTATKKKSPSVDVKDCVTGQEAKDKKEYFDKLEELTGDKLTAKMIKVSEDYQKKYKWEWQGMLNTLIYFFELMERPVVGDCVGILPYWYDVAQRFYSLQPKVNNQDIDQDTYYPHKKVTIKKPKPQKPLIDLTQIGGIDVMR